MLRKIIIVSVAALFILALSGSCSGNQTANNNAGASADSKTKDPVKLVVYFLGDSARDDQEVWDVLNKRTSELINTTFEGKIISWADFGTKFPLLFASGEEFDATFMAHWSFYADLASQGSLYDLSDDFLSEYGPLLKERMPQTAWNQARVGGKVYMIPNTQLEFNNMCMVIRGDLRKKYNVPEITSLDILEQYFDAIAKNETGIIPYDGGSDGDDWLNIGLWFLQPYGYLGSVRGYFYKIDDPTMQLIKGVDIPEYLDFLDKMVDYRERGFWSQSALSQQNTTIDNFRNGTSAFASHNIPSMANLMNNVNDENPQWEPELYDSTFGCAINGANFLGNGMAINANSKNPERALMWLELLRYDRECNDLIELGIEGRHWIDAGYRLSTPGPESGSYGAFSWWGFIDDTVVRKSTAMWEGHQALLDDFFSRLADNAAMYFLFNGEGFENEGAAVDSVYYKNYKALEFGFIPNPRETVMEMDRQYEAGGRQKIVDEVIKQYTEFYESYYNK